LKREGSKVDPKVESYDYGKFGWIMDPEGNWVELWEPPSS
jgi:predicted enzyme related to lactoylglutathione lyase